MNDLRNITTAFFGFGGFVLLLAAALISVGR